MTNETRERLTVILQDVREHADCDITLGAGGAVIYGSHLPKKWQELDWNLLLTLWGDNPYQWDTIIAEYLAFADLWAEKEHAEETRWCGDIPPLRIIGEAADMFSGEFRPVYNREILPG